MTNMAVDYSVQVENAKVEDVVTEIVSGNTTRRSSAVGDVGDWVVNNCVMFYMMFWIPTLVKFA